MEYITCALTITQKQHQCLNECVATTVSTCTGTAMMIWIFKIW